MSVYKKFHSAIEKQIDPVFDKVELLIKRYPKLEKPVMATLILAFPVWCGISFIIGVCDESIG